MVRGICWSHLLSLGVTAPGVPITTVAFIPSILPMSSFSPWHGSSFRVLHLHHWNQQDSSRGYHRGAISCALGLISLSSDRALKPKQHCVLLTCARGPLLLFSASPLAHSFTRCLWCAVFKQHRLVERRCDGLEAYPAGARPLNDILIAFLYLLWNFNGPLSFYL